MEVNKRILVIEDDPEVLSALETYFINRGFDVIAASNGLDALATLNLKHDRIDLILTDLVMPNISGVAVISISKRKYPAIPVIAITGYGEHPEALASEAKADLVFDKPIDLRELEQQILKLIKAGTSDP